MRLLLPDQCRILYNFFYKFCLKYFFITFYLDCKTVVFGRFRKVGSKVSVILKCEAWVSHHSPSPFLHSLQTFRSNMIRRSHSQKVRLFCSLLNFNFYFPSIINKFIFKLMQYCQISHHFCNWNLPQKVTPWNIHFPSEQQKYMNLWKDGTYSALVTGNPHPHPGETWGIRGDLQVLRWLASPQGVGE